MESPDDMEQDLPAASSSSSSSTSVHNPEALPFPEEEEAFESVLHRLHAASGHTPWRNAARLLREAGRPRWQQQMALEAKCHACDSLKPGGLGTPKAATYAIPQPCAEVHLDVAEVTDARTQSKTKFLSMTDGAVKLKKVAILGFAL